jgi:hypothetical protein
MTTETKSTDQRDTPPRHSCCCGSMVCALEDARAILDRRYASGEITKGQYEEMRRQLET